MMYFDNPSAPVRRDPVPLDASPDARLWLYEQIIRMHEEQPAIVEAEDPASHTPWPYRAHRTGCAHCPTGGVGECRYLVWARAEQAEYERTAGYTTVP